MSGQGMSASCNNKQGSLSQSEETRHESCYAHGFPFFACSLMVSEKRLVISVVMVHQTSRVICLGVFSIMHSVNQDGQSSLVIQQRSGKTLPTSLSCPRGAGLRGSCAWTRLFTGWRDLFSLYLLAQYTLTLIACAHCAKLSHFLICSSEEMRKTSLDPLRIPLP